MQVRRVVVLENMGRLMKMNFPTQVLARDLYLNIVFRDQEELINNYFQEEAKADDADGRLL